MSCGINHRAFVSLGGNHGNVPECFAQAREAVAASAQLSIRACSAVYSTEPQGYSDQPWFCNQVLEVCVAPKLTPHALLEQLLCHEQRLGRVRDTNMRFGPRCIDIDLLLFDMQVINAKTLVLPHPRMHLRAFVLVPLLELDPDLCFPDGTRLADALARLHYSVAGTVIRQKE